MLNSKRDCFVVFGAKFENWFGEICLCCRAGARRFVGSVCSLIKMECGFMLICAS